MSLVQNGSLFTERVSRAPISGNIDNPEGGLDALMQVRLEVVLARTDASEDQVMVCGEKIGWREEARRVIVYTTDQVSNLETDSVPPPSYFLPIVSTAPTLPQTGCR